MNEVAYQLKNARTKRGLTIDELAIKIGTSKEHLLNLEKGLVLPDLPLLEKVASELNYSFHIGNVSI
ncbi:helix-turn-helix domain-containing protein [Bacillus salitolerans]|uniref:Helix-turn-helix domain-containing protein n=1 Tax=Bacillus salitolerans TaxID=1437434 RepID=A0ABW4LNH9_9BACI